MCAANRAREGASSSCLRVPLAMAAIWTLGVVFTDDARAEVFVQPTITGTAPCGTNWSDIATGQFLPIRSTGTPASNGLPGAVVYWNTNSGLLQLDPHGHSMSTVIITYTLGTNNVTSTTPGPFYYPSGQTAVNSISETTTVEGRRTFPAVVAVSGLPPTTFASRLGMTIGPPLGPTLATSGDAGNIASTTGYWDQPWAFPTNILMSGLSSTNPAYIGFWSSNSTLAITNFRTVGQSANLNVNLLGYGSQQAVFQYSVNGITGNQIGPVIPCSGKADQTITFPAIGDKVTTDTVGLAATASSGLPVTFTTNAGPAIITGGTNLTFSGTGTVSIVASQEGDDSYNAAPDVTNTFNVTAPAPTSTITFDANGGTPTNAPITQDEGTAVTRPTDPTRDGYTFAGWVPDVPTTMPVDDLTCTAQWQANATATVSPSNGPYVGGNSVLVTNAVPAIGDGGDVTNVTVGGVAATGILGQGTNWVRFTAPATGSAGAKDIVIQSASEGSATLAGAYTVNPAGLIGASTPWDWSTWETTVPMPNKYGYMGAVVYSNKLYSVAGNRDTTRTNEVLSFDGTNWVQDAPLPRVLTSPGVAVYNGRMYSVGGMAPFGVTNVFSYDGTDWRAEPGLPSGRGAVLAAVIGEYLYAIGGMDGGANPSTNVYRFNGTAWAQVAGLPGTDARLCGDFLGGKLHFVGGYSAKTNAYSYDGTNFTAVAALPAPRYYLGAATVQGAFLAYGGTVSASPSNNTYRFDGTNWTHSPNMLLPINYHGSTAFRDQAYAIGGSDSIGRSSNVYRYPARADTHGVSPSSAPWVGGTSVTISGENIGNGADVTNVTLCGVSATIRSQTVSRVWVTAGAAVSLGAGDVRVYSTSYGETVRSNGFTYTGAGIQVSGAGFGPAALGAVVTNLFTVTNSGTAALVITAATNSGAGAGYFDVSALAGLTVAPGTASNVPVVFTASAVGSFTPTCHVANSSPVSGYTFGLAGSVFQASTNAGPFGGGNTITITNGHFGTITNVLVGGVSATILDSGASWFTITLPAAAAAGAVNIVVQTSDNGSTTLANAYTYHAAGSISGLGIAYVNLESAPIEDDNIYMGDLLGTGFVSLVPSGSDMLLMFDTMGIQAIMKSGWTQTLWPQVVWTGTTVSNLPAGTVIDSSMNWLSIDTPNMFGIPLNEYGYVGFRFQFNSQSDWRYGWIRAKRKSFGLGHAVSGMAFTSVDGMTIEAGQTQTGGVVPESGSWTGGYEVVISGTNLCNGADATNVTLCGVGASIQSQSSTQIVVLAGAAVSPGAGDVRVFSTSYGETVKSNAFTYLAPGLQVLGTNGAVIVSDGDAQVANGTKFPPLLSGASWTNTFAITNNGTEPLTISGFGKVNPRFEVTGLPATVAVGGVSNFTVKFAPTGVGTYNDWLTISNTSPTAAYVVRLTGPCFWASTNVGPFGGGNSITIANGNFGNITNVLVNGVAATLVESSGSIFTIVLPAASAAGTVDIVVQTLDNGDILLRDAYTYNSAGAIGWTETDIAWTNLGSGMNDWLECLLHDGTTLYAGGLFTNAGGASARGIAQWNGTSWSSLGSGLSGMNSRVAGLAHDGTNLYAGGSFTNSGGLALNRVARWNGSSWSALGSGVGAPGYSDLAWDVLVAGGNLYAAGRFTNAGATAVMNIAMWDGTSWSPLGDGLGQAATMDDSYDVRALAHDGTNLYAGGEFTTSGGLTVNRVAMWNGTTWTNLGTGLDDEVSALLHDGRNLYAAGGFHTAGGVTAHRIAMWNGTSWTNLGSGMDFVVEALAHDGTNLYAGGSFTTAGGVAASLVAKWDGANWSPLGSGITGNLVRDILFHGADLYAGGWFTAAGGVPAANVAQWKTTVVTNDGVNPASGSWTGGYEVVIGGSNLGNGGDITNVTLCGVAASIQSQNATQVVVVAGATLTPGAGDVRVFSTSFGETTKIGAFTYEGAGILVSGPAFGPLPVGASATNLFSVTNSGTEALTITVATNSGTGAAMFDVSALAGLTVAPGTASNVPVVFTASAVGTFNPACHAANNSPVPGYSFGLYGSVYQLSANSGPQAGGNTITVTNGHFGTITNVLVGPLGVVPVASGANWFTIVVPAAAGAGTVDIVVQTSDNGETTLAGSYTYNPPGQIGWTTGMTIWTNMGSGVNNTPLAMYSEGQNLYVGGTFTTAGGQSANRVAMWNGSNWTNLGTGLDNNVSGLSGDGTNLYAVGSFGSAGGVPAANVAKWDGTSWTNLGSGLGNSGAAVLVAGSTVYVGGYFTNVGAVAAGGIAAWDGANWTNLGSGLNSGARCLAHDGTNLYVGGQFTNAGGVAVMNVAKWNGTSWTNMSSGIGDRWANVYSLDFIGSTLYACGLFDAGSGKRRVAKWNGSSWTDVGNGVGGDAYSMTQDGTNLYVSGNFTSPGNYVAKWNGTAWSGLGSGLNSSAWTLAHDGTTLYAGGGFDTAGGLSVSRIAMWTPTVATNPGVAPQAGSYTGGYEVVIQGYNLGNGTDITNVTLCGVAASIQSQDATQVVVRAGAAAPGVGDVSVFSTSQGETVKSNGFTYTAAGIAVSGPAFGPLPFGAVRTNVYTVTNSGTEALLITAVTNVGLSAAMFDASAIPATVAAGTASNFPVVYTASSIGIFSIDCFTVNNSPNPNYYFGLTGSCFVVWTNIGPSSGGGTIVINWGRNGRFGTITNVLVGSASVAYEYTSVNSFRILVLPGSAAGTVDIVVQTSDIGDITLEDAYTYNPAGEISGVLPATGSCTGGFEVVIGGTNLGNGLDITNVTICGGAATSISSQSATQVVVVAGAAPAGVGDVVVQSTSYGETVASNAFECLRAVQGALVFAPASPQAENSTNALSMTGGSGTGAVSFVVMDGPGLIVDETNLVATAGTGTITVVATKAGDDLYYAASVTSTVVAAYAADVYLLDLRQIYDGAAKAASATTMPAGLTVQFTYNGFATAPTATGTYAVVGTVNDGQYWATATGTLQVLAPWDYQHVTFSNGWCWVEWFGFYAPMGNGWIWHEKHGFFYLAPGQLLDDAWMYAEDMGWLWSGKGVYPFLYREEDLSWLWYDGRTNPRWFYNFTGEEWESINP